MTDKTPAMPELPEPELGYIETDKSKQPAFSARQMRVALQSAQPAEVSDEELLTAYNSIDPCNESPTDRLIRRLRAILALRPQAVPVEAARLAGVALSEHPGHSPLTDWEDAAMKACSLLAARPLPNPPKDPA